MAPIRLAIIGLSQNSKTSWASQGHLPYLLSDRGRARYQISALLNTTVESGRRAVEYYNLPPSTRTYASPEELAADPDIDLVVNTTRVDVHYDTIRPSIAAGKAVYVEWPLAENAERANELATLAASAQATPAVSMVGLQTRVSPAIVKLKTLLRAGDLGKVLSSSVQAYAPQAGRDSISSGLSYFFDRKIGGNHITIAFAHMLDYVHSVLGEFVEYHAHTQNQRPKKTIIHHDTKTTEACISDVPDLVSVHGTLQTSELVAEGASLLATFRTGPPFPGTTPFVWTINCEKGEIRVSSVRGPFLQSESNEFPIPIEVHTFETDEVVTHHAAWEEWQESLPGRGRNVAKLYDLYADGDFDASVHATLSSAAARHREIDSILG